MTSSTALCIYSKAVIKQAHGCGHSECIITKDKSIITWEYYQGKMIVYL